LALKLKASAVDLVSAPGSDALAELGACVMLDLEAPSAVAAWCAANRPDLVVAGPEVPLVAGVGDAVRALGIPVFGHDAATARLEGSKAFAKDFMVRHAIPCAASHTVTDLAAGEALIRSWPHGYPIVLKADGLAAGKGVIICATEAQAREAADVFFTEQRFGDTEVVIEEFLEGEELSLLALCDGENVLPLAPAQDYKRIYDGDEGPNTGGMGSYSPVPGFDPAETERITDLVHRPVVQAMRRRGTPFHGVLYAGLMLTEAGPKVLEFNCRFGDPETQTVLPRLRSDLLALCMASRETGGLAGLRADFGNDWAVTIVLASAGYPASSSKGDVIEGLDKAAAVEGVEVTHAGTARSDGRVVTAGGRVLNVTGLGPTVADARRRAYDAAELISFSGKQMRTDIAERAVDRAAAA
jgi:phosphoribosylamine---glycine ligase